MPDSLHHSNLRMSQQKDNATKQNNKKASQSKMKTKKVAIQNYQFVDRISPDLVNKRTISYIPKPRLTQ